MMINKNNEVNREELNCTNTLEQAVEEIFCTTISGRTCLLRKEEMSGEVAAGYDEIGKSSRQQTYKNIALDFKNTTECYASRHLKTYPFVGAIIDVGCGSGLLSLELEEQTNARIIGVDLSKDMIALANKNLKQRSDERKAQTLEFWKRLPECCKPTSADYEKLKQNPLAMDRVNFIQGSVYELPRIVQGIKNINYVVCRNALHRFNDTDKAIMQMYKVLNPGGKLYLRDLRRDADWKTIIERIGEKRWKIPPLIIDNIRAMANMLTVKELKEKLDSLGIKKYFIREGYYNMNHAPRKDSSQLKEYEKEVEYVCVIEK